MKTNWIRISVPLAPNNYQVLIGKNLLEHVGPTATRLQLGNKAAVVTDSNVGPLYSERVLASLREAGFPAESFTVPAGEASKSISRAEELCQIMTETGYDRKSFVVALGGGVVGDLAGFVAGIFYRGIPCIQVPTTIVAQVDSSVGGKTGVNIKAGKNLVGVFHQPRAVLADTDTLLTLPEREYREGFAEVIKHAAIRDRDMCPMISRALDRKVLSLPDLIGRNVAIKAAIVTEDEKETRGTRALLNFGHTIGHAIEAASGYGTLLHGEAISLGLRAAIRVSREVAGLKEEDAATIEALLDEFQLPAQLSDDLTTEEILGFLKKDKKFINGQIRFVLIKRLGEAFVSDEVDEKMIEKAIEELRLPPPPKDEENASA